MDLSGCTIDELLYNVNQGRPLIAVLDAQTTLMIVGYSDGTVSCEDIGSGARSNHAQSDLCKCQCISGSKIESEIFVLALRRAQNRQLSVLALLDYRFILLSCNNQNDR